MAVWLYVLLLARLLIVMSRGVIQLLVCAGCVADAAAKW